MQSFMDTFCSFTIMWLLIIFNKSSPASYFLKVMYFPAMKQWTFYTCLYSVSKGKLELLKMSIEFVYVFFSL